MPRDARPAFGTGGRSTDDGTRSPEDRRRCAPENSPGGQSWEETHRRVTFYCPVDLLARIEVEVAHGERSKSQIIVGALVGALVSDSHGS